MRGHGVAVSDDVIIPYDGGTTTMRSKKTQDPKQNGTIRPWLVDVVVDDLR